MKWDLIIDLTSYILHRITIFGIRGTFTGWVDNSCPYTALQYTTSGHSLPIYVDGKNWNRSLYITFPSEDYVKNLIATFPYVQASISGSYYTIGNESSKFSAQIYNNDARNEYGSYKDAWQIAYFNVGAGASSTYNVTGSKYKTVTFLTRGNDNNPTSYGTQITVLVSVRKSTSNNGWLNTIAINFLKS